MEWGETPACAYKGRITSLSAGGCFVQTRRREVEGATVFIRVLLAPQAENVLEGVLMARVIYHLERVGFGVKFLRLKASDESDIRDLVEFYFRGTDG